jgi:hypothetical protein
MISIDFNVLKLNTVQYFKAIGYHNYLALSSTPDVMCIYPILSAFSQKLTKLAWRAVIKIFAHLLGKKNKILFYRFNSDPRSVSLKSAL